MDSVRLNEGDLVHIKEDLGPMMNHFTKGEDAVVIEPYRDGRGKMKPNMYALYIKKKGFSAWYPREVLVLKEKNVGDVQWRVRAKKLGFMSKFDEFLLG